MQDAAAGVECIREGHSPNGGARAGSARVGDSEGIVDSSPESDSLRCEGVSFQIAGRHYQVKPWFHSSAFRS